jgi:hypothetical protein
MKKHIMTVCIAFTIAAVLAADVANHSVIKKLRRIEAPGADWAAFGTGSFVRSRLHSVGTDITGFVSSAESTQVHTVQLSDRTADDLTMVAWDGEEKQFAVSLRFALDDSQFADSNGTRLADDSVAVGGKVYPAQVYQFEKQSVILGETQTRRWVFWLSPDVPGGELRRITESKSDDPTYGWREEVRLSDLRVPLVVGKKTLVCYAIDSENRDVNGLTTRIHKLCNDTVPGKVVSEVSREIKGGKEIGRQESVVIDYHVERLNQ